MRFLADVVGVGDVAIDRDWVTVDISYNGGLRYPRLVKIRKGDGPLDILLRKR